MKFGVSINTNDSVADALAKGLEIEGLGLDHVWVLDLPSQRYSPAVAAAVASTTRKVRIGLGLISPFLHTPQQIASSLTTLIEFYGGRFELCIGPGDRVQLERVGVDLDAVGDIPNHMINAKDAISEALGERGLKCRIWLGAQGPRLLKIASHFDGVLLNYSSPEMIRWALEVIERSRIRQHTIIGVFAPSYVYKTLNIEMYKLLKLASVTVAMRASSYVLKKFALLKSIEPARRELLKRPLNSVESILSMIPSDVVEKFSIFKSQKELRDYIERLETLGVEHIVFSYPQASSIEALRELVEVLKLEGCVTS